jgi:hypothetical protein
MINCHIKMMDSEMKRVKHQNRIRNHVQMTNAERRGSFASISYLLEKPQKSLNSYRYQSILLFLVLNHHMKFICIRAYQFSIQE